jgi:beta-phosphoglucomutase
MSTQSKWACLWDMDDVLVDSGPAHFAAWQALGRELGYSFTWDQHRESLGRRTPDILRLAWGLTGPADAIAHWTERKEALFREQAGRLQPLPGAVELVRALQQAGWAQAVASSGPPANVRLSLQVLGLTDVFAAIVTGADVRHGKPDPEIFRTALLRLGATPERRVVMEDAVTGEQAGKAAGAVTIGITNTHPQAALEQTGADWVLETLVGLDPARLAQLVTATGGRT